MFTAEQLEATLREIVASDPDHVYVQGMPMRSAPQVRCYYQATTPGAVEACLFGRAFAALGVTPHQLAAVEGKSATAAISIWNFPHPFHPRFVGWVVTLQSGQDQGMTWGEALRMADSLWPLS